MQPVRGVNQLQEAIHQRYWVLLILLQVGAQAVGALRGAQAREVDASQVDAIVLSRLRSTAPTPHPPGPWAPTAT